MKMQPKSKRIATIIACSLLAVLLLGLFAGCAAKENMAFSGSGLPQSAAPGEGGEMDYGNVAMQNMLDKELNDNLTARTTTAAGAQEGRFVIAIADISIQTKTYDAFSSAMLAELKALGGYTNAFEEWNYDTDRSARVVARVPSQKLDAFLESLAKNGTVVSKSVTTSDVTDEMIETGSKKEALMNEEKALLAILEKATTVEDIIRVQDRLSAVRADLQAYSQKLQTLQNQVNYSTVNIDVREVNRISIPTQKFSALASSGFLNSLRSIGQGLRSFAIWFIGAIPHLVLIAILAVPVVLILRRVRKNRKAKKAAMDR